jgi:sn-glycerol 3-phosphate transport system ATP-binding protein
VFVARFIGTPPMNLVKLEAGAHGTVIAGTAGPAVAPAALANTTLGVRPEHVVMGDADGVEVRVENVEYLGADSLLTCRVGSELLTARVDGRVSLRCGDGTRLGWARGALHFFSGSDGSRQDVDASQQTATMIA